MTWKQWQVIVGASLLTLLMSIATYVVRHVSTMDFFAGLIGVVGLTILLFWIEGRAGRVGQ